jgi:transglutaminase-like putative cysteine protease
MQTLRIMRAMTRNGRKHPVVRLAAQSLVADLPAKDLGLEVRRIHAFVRDDIRYVRDIRGVETVHAPEVTLRLGSGDCDDKAVLAAALLESIGHRTRFMAVGFGPGQLSHVMPEVQLGPHWVPLEVTEPVPPGWFPPGVIERMPLAV